MKVNALALAGLVAVAVAPSAAFATPVYGTDVLAADLSGSRSISGGGLVNGGGSFTAATLTWLITDNGDGTLHYKYSVDTDSHQGLSHFIWDLSDNCTAVGSCFQNLSLTGGTLGAITFGTYTSGNGNPGMPGSIIGVKADVTDGASDFSFEFDSDRVPVWADVYSKGGNGTTNGFALYNAGLSFEATDSNIGDFVAMPDSVTITNPGYCETHPDLCSTQGTVPEPGTLALFGAGLVGLGRIRRRKRQ